MNGRWGLMPPISSSGSGRWATAATAAFPIPSEGALDEVARPAGGYLWDKAAEKGVSYRSYGEWVANGKTAADPATASIKAIEGHFDPMYPQLRHGLPGRQTRRPIPRGAGRV